MRKCGNLVARRTNDVRTPRAGEASIFLSKFRCAACGRVRDIASEAGGSLALEPGDLCGFSRRGSLNERKRPYPVVQNPSVCYANNSKEL